MKKSELKAIIKECLNELGTTEPTTKSIKLRRHDLAKGSRAAQRGHQQAIRLRNGLQEDEPIKSGKRPGRLYGGTDVLKSREDLARNVKRMPVPQSYKNKITKAWIKNDRANIGSLRQPYEYVDGKQVTRPTSKRKLG